MKRRRMLRNVLNFELSSCGFSACALAGVEAREASFELMAEVVAAGSAMVQCRTRILESSVSSSVWPPLSSIVVWRCGALGLGGA
jgi:hypothetical protein